MEDQRRLLAGEAELLPRRVDDADVGLVRDDERDVIGGVPPRDRMAALERYIAYMARELEKDYPQILVNAACPGWVRTELGGPDAPRTTDEGADTIVWLATLPGKGPNGGLFRDRAAYPW